MKLALVVAMAIQAVTMPRRIPQAGEMLCLGNDGQLTWCQMANYGGEWYLVPELSLPIPKELR